MHRDDEATLDAVAIMMNKSAPRMATRDDLLNLLQWLLLRYPNVVIIIDGVDECSDPNELLKYLARIDAVPVASHGSGIPDRAGSFTALFQRPTVKIPPLWEAKAQRLALSKDHNHKDIRNFLLPAITELQRSGLLADIEDVQQMATKAAKHANGMFLWARLLLDYLSSDALTCEDRSEAMKNMVFLESLESLYGAILITLQQTLQSEKSRTTVKHIFSWLSVCFRPLEIQELRVALSISDHGNMIPNLESSLRRMTGALVEITAHGIVRFIHLSVLQYLQRQGKRNYFGLDSPDSIHCFIATSCLSYWIDHLPHGPIAGSLETTPDSSVQSLQYPFLGYSVRFWCDHFRGSVCQQHFEEMPIKELLAALKELTTDNVLASTWIEASWTFGVQPNLKGIVDTVNILVQSGKWSQELLKLLSVVKSDLSDFASDLGVLNREWSAVLSTTPNEIWKGNIAGFFKSRFWHSEVEDTQIFSLGASSIDAPNTRLIQSQSSSDGKHVGCIKLRIPTYVLASLYLCF